VYYFFIVIDVDEARPESNREFMVHTFNAKKDGVKHDGYDITCEVDIREITAPLGDVPKARLLDEHSIVVERDVASPTFMEDRAAFDANQKTAGCFIEDAADSHTVTANRIKQFSDIQKQEYILRFEKPLSNKIYSPSAQNAEISMTVVPYTNTVEFMGTTYTNLRAKAVWRVSVIEAVDRIVSQQSSANSATAKMHQSFQGMAL
jgi:hypothetical protein